MTQPTLPSHNSTYHITHHLDRNPSQLNFQTSNISTEMEQQWRSAEEVFFTAIKLYINCNFDRAEIEFKRALQICPEFYGAQRYLNLMPTARQVYAYTLSARELTPFSNMTS